MYVCMYVCMSMYVCMYVCMYSQKIGLYAYPNFHHMLNPISYIESRSLDLLKNTQLEQTVAIIANPFGRTRRAITRATQNLGYWGAGDAMSFII